MGNGNIFNKSEIKGELSFKYTTFIKPKAQEEACRKAKQIWEGLGDRSEEDHYFYREMEAKRKQRHLWISINNKFLTKNKLIYMGYLELPIQYLLGYGVFPFRVIGLWIMFVFIFGLLFGLLNVVNGINISLDYLWVSIFTATGFDYGVYQLRPEFQWLASIEIVFGLFIWSAFLVIFARKYMR
jgi:hypothetical protein